jgi:hypothetical protein
MREGTKIVMLATVLLLVITLVAQGSVFDSANAVGKSLTNIAAAITYSQNYGKTITGNNLELPSSLITQQSASDPNQASFKNIAFPSATQSSNLTAIFKQIENSVVQITAKTPNPNLQIILNGIPLKNQSTRLGPLP